MISNKFSYLKAGEAKYDGIVHNSVLFTEEHQLLNKKTWDNFIDVFSGDNDEDDFGWRCEFWGKMMRGACLTYMYRGTDELYSVIEYAVRGLLKNQRADGRFSSYSAEKEFQGWDLWGRKYVLTGMIHFIAICRDERLKSEALDALCRHADYIVEHIGENEGKISILKTSSFWLGVNSCSILEPFCELYKLTGKQAYLDFAKYIVSLGGCDSDISLIELALADEKAPFEYPQTKAYETMSFFEGLLAFYEITEESLYLEAVKKFVEKVNDTDITIIGCAGCEGELFDNSVLKQTMFSVHEMQETCVTVTWMRLLARLLLVTGEARYADRIERSAFNALYGSLNTKRQKGYSLIYKVITEPLPFDSYSPLVANKRGISIAGLQPLKSGGEYGCCACIGSAGTGIFPLISVMRSTAGIVINELTRGEVNTTTASGQDLGLSINSSYPTSGKATIRLALEYKERFCVSIRVPRWCSLAEIKVGDYSVKPDDDGYCVIDRIWQDGDSIDVDFHIVLVPHKLNEKTAYTYGPVVLARDEKKEGRNIEAITPKLFADDYRLLPPEGDECVRVAIKSDDGELILTDYASCGKHWNSYFTRVSVWLD